MGRGEGEREKMTNYSMKRLIVAVAVVALLMSFPVASPMAQDCGFITMGSGPCTPDQNWDSSVWHGYVPSPDDPNYPAGCIDNNNCVFVPSANPNITQYYYDKPPPDYGGCVCPADQPEVIH